MLDPVVFHNPKDFFGDCRYFVVNPERVKNGTVEIRRRLVVAALVGVIEQRKGRWNFRFRSSIGKMVDRLAPALQIALIKMPGKIPPRVRWTDRQKRKEKSRRVAPGDCLEGFELGLGQAVESEIKNLLELLEKSRIVDVLHGGLREIGAVVDVLFSAKASQALKQIEKIRRSPAQT